MADLFDNDMVRNALKSMTPEQLEYYQKIGEQMYNTVDFEKNRILDIAPSDEEMLRYIKSSFNSGLLPEDLEEGEKAFLHNMFGNEWYKHFGFTSMVVGDSAPPSMVVGDSAPPSMVVGDSAPPSMVVGDSNGRRSIGSSSTPPSKQKRNDKCICLSGKKYKKCCGK